MPMRALVCVWATAALAACAASPTPGSPRVAPRGRATIFFSPIPGSGGRTFPSPLVRGRVGALPAILVIDTGAQVSTIDAAIARAAGLPLESASAGHDPTGQPVRLERSDRPSLVIDGWGALPEQRVAVVALPEPLRRLGVGAIVSPQALVGPSEAVVIDVPRRELERTSLRAATAALASRGVELVPVASHLCREQTGEFERRVLVAPATVAGRSSVLELDTGASGCFVISESEAGRSVSARGGGESGTRVGAAGPIEVRTYPDVPVAMGAVRATTSLSVTRGARDAACGYEGRLGMDVLRHCVIVVNREQVFARCDQVDGPRALAPVH